MDPLSTISVGSDPPDAPSNDLRPDPNARVPARLVVHDRMYFQPAGRGRESQPAGEELIFSRYLRSDEQLYVRKGKAGPDWRPLELGWIDPTDCGQLLLRNLEGTDLATIPTPEEREQMDARQIELMVTVHPAENVGIPFAVVRPGESMRLEPLSVQNYRIRSAVTVPARYSLTLVPG